MKYTSLSMAAAFGNAMASAASSPHGGGGSISIHPKRMDVGAISFGNHQGPVVMKEARFGGGVDGNSSTGGNGCGSGGGLEVVTARTQSYLGGGGGYDHRGSTMVDVAVEGGGISGDPYGGEGCWGEGLGLANEDGSGVVAKSNTLQVGLVGGTKGWKGNSGRSGDKDVSSLAGRREDVVDIHELSGGNSGVFADVLWQDLVQVTADSRRDGVVSSEKLGNGNISSFKDDGDELNNHSALVDEIEPSINNKTRKYGRPNFLVAFAVLIFVMVMASASSFFLSSRFVFMPAVLSFTYARGIYDRGCKTLRTVLLKSVPSLYPMPNHSGGKSRCRSRRKGRGKGYHSLLVSLVVVLSIVDIGEARWFGDTNDGGVIEGVTEVFDDANVEKVNMDQSISRSGRFGQDLKKNGLRNTASSNAERDISSDVFEELLLLQGGPSAAFRIQGVARRIHEIAVRDEENSPHARRRALHGLKLGADKFKRHVQQDTERHLANLANVDSLPDSRALSASSVVGAAAFATILVFLVFLLVTNLVDPSGATFDFLGTDNIYLQGVPGASYSRILGCNKLPFVPEEIYGYLPITQGFVENLGAEISGFDAFVDILEALSPSELQISDDNLPTTASCKATDDTDRTCEYTTECCPPGEDDDFVVTCNPDNNLCEQGPAVLSFEPFCLAWSKPDSTSTTIDTFAFAPLLPWPPIELVPKLIKVAPFCPIGGGCSLCELVLGYPITDFNIGPVPFKLTIQFDGVAVSWATTGKLAYGTNSATSGDNAPQIWDGFINQPLPVIDGINFWIRLRFNIIDLAAWTAERYKCSTIGTADPLPGAGTFLRIILDVELYIAFDKEINGTETGNQLAGDLTGSDRRHLAESEGEAIWRRMQESTTSSDPCIILTMPKAAIKLPKFVGDIVFADALGGYCITPPDAQTGIRCSPSGFFFNIRNEFRIEGGLAGALASVIDFSESGVELPPVESSGNSIGIFQDLDGETEAVVFRLEWPTISIFGIGSAPQPVVHFQYIKGSEVERRRATLLRRKANEEDDWVYNCARIEEQCPDTGWDTFELSGTTDIVEICTDIVLNPDQDPDKLLYYNRVLTAEPVDPNLKYLITPDPGESYKVPAKYDFSNNLGADVIIVYLSINNIGNIVIKIDEISITLIFSDGPPPSVDEIEFASAEAAFDNAQVTFINDLQAVTYRAPSRFNFNEAEYTDYIAASDWTGLDDEEIDTQVELAESYNAVTDSSSSDRLAVFIRLFCQISVLFFVTISVGLIMENFADGESPSLWAVAGQFEIDLLDLRYSTAVSTTIDFDRRRYRHLEGEEYHRALASDGLEEASWIVAMSVDCVPDSLCEAFVKFFEDVGEAIWDGCQAIATFLEEDVVEFFNDAVALVGEWGEFVLDTIKDLGENIANDIQDIFEDGNTVNLLRGERVQAFGSDAVATYDRLTDGQITLDDALAVGELLVEGLAVGVSIVLAGIADVADALESFFSNVISAVGDVLNIGSSDWTEARPKATFTSPNDCKVTCDQAKAGTLPGSLSPGDQIKKGCWCTDELSCPVKISQTRSCSETCYVVYCDKDCGSWQDVPIQKGSGFPRSESRKFDEGCREDRLAKLAQTRQIHVQQVDRTDTIQRNVNTKIQGLQSFSSGARRRRRLSPSDTTTAVGSVSVNFTAVDEAGNFVSNTLADYTGSQLRPDSTDTNTVTDVFSASFDFSDFQNPTGQDRRLAENSLVLDTLQKGAANQQYLSKLEFDDPKFLGRQPIIASPRIALVDTLGTEDNPVAVGCEGSFADAWRRKLDSTTIESMRRKRSRRLMSSPMDETAVELAVENSLRMQLMDGDIQVEIEEGGVDDDAEDIFGITRELLGADGLGGALDNSRRRRLTTVSLDEFIEGGGKLKFKVMSAVPSCEKFNWEFVVFVENIAGQKSEPISLFAELTYGNPSLRNPSYSRNVQTLCDTDKIGVDDLEDNQPLQFYYDVEDVGFSPKLNNANCRSPSLSLISSDTTIQDGERCTTTYKTVSRSWMYDLEECTVDLPTLDPQTVIAGGYVVPAGDLSEPIFDLQDKVYYLPNERNAQVPTAVEDFYKSVSAIPGSALEDSPEPRDRCGICNITYSHPQDFNCSEVGQNTVSVTIVNSIGLSVTKNVTAIVIDDKPPNMITKDHTVFLNRFGWLNASDIVAVEDINDESWDNCGIISLSVSPTPIYECNDEGPQTVTLRAVDPSSNVNTKDQTVIVDDSSRLSINDDKPVVMPSVTDNLIDRKMSLDFDYKKCEETDVYVRPQGSSNFVKYDEFSNGVNNKWSIPKFYNKNDEQSVLFYISFCGGILPEDVNEGNLCEGEVKSKVLCEDFRGPKKALQKTCYRAKLTFDPSSGDGKETLPWEEDATTNPLSPPSSSPTSAPTSKTGCLERRETPPDGDCSRCCSGKCNKKGKCRRVS